MLRHDGRLPRRVRMGPMVVDTWGWVGIVTFRFRDPATGVVLRQHTVRNLVTTAGRNWLRDVLRGAHSDPRILYLEWGTSTTAPAVGDTALGAAVGRAALTGYETGAAGEVVSTCYLDPDQAVGTWEEWGWFGGDAATTTAGTGELIARVLDNVVKEDIEALEVQRKDGFTA